MFARISFLPTLFYNIFMERVSSRNWYDRIDSTIVLGALPFSSVVPKLIEEEKVKGVVSMNEDFELRFCMGREDWAKLNIGFLQLNTRDIFSAPSQDKLIRGVEFINDYCSRNETVYVHCKAGRTRSATLVACYLMDKYDLTPVEAVEKIACKRPHVLLHAIQWEAMDEYYKNRSTRNK